MSEEQDAYFMERALALAELALTKGQAPFGAVVVGPDGTLVGEGHNTVNADLDPSAHGEVVAIRYAAANLGNLQMEGFTLYTSCEPCLLCTSVIVRLGISRVVFAARDSDVPTNRPLLGANLTEAAEWVNAQPDWSPIEVRGDFMRERGQQILAAYNWGG
jgi:tRNA(Arg) A34 adenosine deaminase TadA